MKKTYLIILFLIISITTIFVIYTYKSTNLTKHVNNTYSKINSIDENNKYKIQIYFPITKYNLLNIAIKKEIDKNLKEFKKYSLEFPVKEDFYYTFYVLYDEYYYQNYISIVLYFEEFTGGAHPIHFIKTFVYDKETNKLLTIDDLLTQNKNLLNELSTIVRKELLKIPKYQDPIVKSMLLDGTKPTKENFSKFALTKDGLKVYFDYYQIAPYYYGNSELTIPYKDLNL